MQDSPQCILLDNKVKFDPVFMSKIDSWLEEIDQMYVELFQVVRDMIRTLLIQIWPCFSHESFPN